MTLRYVEEIQGEKNMMEFTFYVITVIVLSEAWMETKAHTQTHESEATAALCKAQSSLLLVNEKSSETTLK